MSKSLYSASIYPLSMPMMFLSKNKPTNLTLLILIMSLSLNTTFFLSQMNKWIPLIMTLMFSGGIMILFSFFTSISPTSKYKKLKIMFTIAIIISLIMVNQNKSNSLINYQNFSLMYQTESFNLLMITTILMLMTINIQTQTIKINSPLKSCY